jgi:hypothetical protein
MLYLDKNQFVVRTNDICVDERKMISSSYRELQPVPTQSSLLGFLSRGINLPPNSPGLSDSQVKLIQRTFNATCRMASDVEKSYKSLKQSFEEKQQPKVDFNDITLETDLGINLCQAARDTDYRNVNYVDLIVPGLHAKACTHRDDYAFKPYDDDNKAFISPILGFGHNHVQLYSKQRLSYTHFHSELGYSEAINVNHHHSNGISIWLGFNYLSALNIMPKHELDDILYADRSIPVNLTAIIQKFTQPQHGKPEKFYIGVQYPKMVCTQHQCLFACSTNVSI